MPPKEPKTRPSVLDASLMHAPASARHDAPAPQHIGPPSEKFRTSIYYDRTTHDRLREIAFHERKTVTDLINEGIEHVLQKRAFAVR
jgi:hypothetical protein